MAKLILSHEVANYDSWKKGFDSDDSNRAAAGVTNSKVYRNVENPNSVTLISDIADVEQVKAMLANPQLQEAMKNAGVTSQPTITFLEEA